MTIGQAQDAAQRTAFGKENYDNALHLLEKLFTKKPLHIKKTVQALLQPDYERTYATSVHEAILKLSTTKENKVRLISTNFDRIFSDLNKYNKLEKREYSAPLLPQADKMLDGIVHLHGLLPPGDGEELNGSETSDKHDLMLKNLVMTSGDFGRAYLIEQWGSRFLSSLFQQYSVCFVGYGVNDPIVRYAVDAIAALKNSGVDLPNFYAFASFDNDDKKQTEEIVTNQWNAKSIKPLLYSSIEDHEQLRQCLEGWADFYFETKNYRRGWLSTHDLSTYNSELKDDLSFALKPNDQELFELFRNKKPTIEWLPFIKEELSLSCFQTETPNECEQIIEWWVLDEIATPQALPCFIRSMGGVKISGFFELKLQNKLHCLAQDMSDIKLHNLWQTVIYILKNRIEDCETYSIFWLKLIKEFGPTEEMLNILKGLLLPRICVDLDSKINIDDGSYEHLEPLYDDRDWLKSEENFEVVDQSLRYYLKLQGLFVENSPGYAGIPFLRNYITRKSLSFDKGFPGVGGFTQRKSFGIDKCNPYFKNCIQNIPLSYYKSVLGSLVEFCIDGWIELAANNVQKARSVVFEWLNLQYPLYKRLAFCVLSEKDCLAPKDICDVLLYDDSKWILNIASEQDIQSLRGIHKGNLSREHCEIYKKVFHRTFGVEMPEPQKLIKEAFLRIVQEQPNEATEVDNEIILDDNASCDGFKNWLKNWSENQQRSETSLQVKACFNRFSYFNTAKCIQAFIELGRDGLYPRIFLEISISNWAISNWVEYDGQEDDFNKFADYIDQMPEKRLKELSWHILHWLTEQITNNLMTPRLPLVRKLFDLHKNDSLTGGDSLWEINLNIDGDALKHPIGFIAEYVMALHKAYPELQDDCLLLFESMINDQGEASGCGRSRILQNANYLFDKNEEWFKNNLLDEFNWANGDRAQQSWLALSWSQSDSSPKLIHLTLSYFSSSIAKASLLTGYFGTHFRSFLSWILLQFHDQFTGKQKDIITDSLNKSQEMIESIAKEAMKRIDELPNGGTPAECCKKTLLPFFKSEFFPKTDIAMSSEVTSCLLDICVLAGDAFPSAVNCLRYWMEATPPKRPLHYLMILPNNPCYQIWRQKFPNEMLQWLKCLGLETFNNPHELRMCCEKLQEILDVLPTTAVKDDPLFKRLEALYSRHQ